MMSMSMLVHKFVSVFRCKSRLCPCASLLYSRAGNSLIGFPSESLIFCPKMSEWSIHSKKLAIHSFFTHSLIFGERPERFAQDRSFPLSDVSESLMVAHFWWASWAIRRVGHRVLLRCERIVLLRSFKARNILLRSFFEFLATYETQKNDAFFCVLFLRK